MSSDESATEDDQAVFVVKDLPWRSDKVTTFYKKIDSVGTDFISLSIYICYIYVYFRPYVVP